MNFDLFLTLTTLFYLREIQASGAGQADSGLSRRRLLGGPEWAENNAAI